MSFSPPRGMDPAFRSHGMKATLPGASDMSFWKTCIQNFTAVWRANANADNWGYYNSSHCTLYRQAKKWMKSEILNFSNKLLSFGFSYRQQLFFFNKNYILLTTQKIYINFSFLKNILHFQISLILIICIDVYQHFCLVICIWAKLWENLFMHLCSMISTFVFAA